MVTLEKQRMTSSQQKIAGIVECGSLKTLWYRRPKSENERELRSQIKWKGAKNKFQLRLGPDVMRMFLLDYERKSTNPLRVYFCILVWSVAVLGPAQDLSTREI